MIKARGKTALGEDLVLLGLSGENVTRLVAGEPMKFSLADVELAPIQVAIVYGKTEEAILEQLRGARRRLLRPDTRNRPRPPVGGRGPEIPSSADSYRSARPSQIRPPITARTAPAAPSQ